MAYNHDVLFLFWNLLSFKYTVCFVQNFHMIRILDEGIKCDNVTECNADRSDLSCLVIALERGYGCKGELDRVVKCNFKAATDGGGPQMERTRIWQMKQNYRSPHDSVQQSTYDSPKNGEDVGVTSSTPAATVSNNIVTTPDYTALPNVLTSEATTSHGPNVETSGSKATFLIFKHVATAGSPRIISSTPSTSITTSYTASASSRTVSTTSFTNTANAAIISHGVTLATAKLTSASATRDSVTTTSTRNIPLTSTTTSTSTAIDRTMNTTPASTPAASTDTTVTPTTTARPIGHTKILKTELNTRTEFRLQVKDIPNELALILVKDIKNNCTYFFTLTNYSYIGYINLKTWMKPIVAIEWHHSSLWWLLDSGSLCTFDLKTGKPKVAFSFLIRDGKYKHLKLYGNMAIAAGKKKIYMRDMAAHTTTLLVSGRDPLHLFIGRKEKYVYWTQSSVKDHKIILYSIRYYEKVIHFVTLLEETSHPMLMDYKASMLFVCSPTPYLYRIKKGKIAKRKCLTNLTDKCFDMAADGKTLFILTEKREVVITNPGGRVQRFTLVHNPHHMSQVQIQIRSGKRLKAKLTRPKPKISKTKKYRTKKHELTKPKKSLSRKVTRHDSYSQKGKLKNYRKKKVSSGSEKTPPQQRKKRDVKILLIFDIIGGKAHYLWLPNTDLIKTIEPSDKKALVDIEFCPLTNSMKWVRKKGVFSCVLPGNCKKGYDFVWSRGFLVSAKYDYRAELFFYLSSTYLTIMKWKKGDHPLSIRVSKPGLMELDHRRRRVFWTETGTTPYIYFVSYEGRHKTSCRFMDIKGFGVDPFGPWLYVCGRRAIEFEATGKGYHNLRYIRSCIDMETDGQSVYILTETELQVYDKYTRKMKKIPLPHRIIKGGLRLDTYRVG